MNLLTPSGITAMSADSPVEMSCGTILLEMLEPFHISGYVFRDTPAFVVTLTQDGHVGRGEASGVYYLDDRPGNMAAVLEPLRERIRAGMSREELRAALPPCGARNALDCAMWELEAKRTGRSVGEIAGLHPLRKLLTTMTLGADEPDVMAAKALGYAQARALKLKLTGDTELDIRRVQAVRSARPDVWMGVDANQGYTGDLLPGLIKGLREARVSLLEQPCRRGFESELDGVSREIPIAADESVQDLDELEALAERFDVVNIKLDKCGGLTEGLLIAARAKELGLGVMVGNMLGTSLAMAPAFILGQQCDVVDLDGPLFITNDRTPSVTYVDGYIDCPGVVWGTPESLA